MMRYDYGVDGDDPPLPAPICSSHPPQPHPRQIHAPPGQGLTTHIKNRYLGQKDTAVHVLFRGQVQLWWYATLPGSTARLNDITTLRHYDITTHYDALRHITTLRHYDSQDGPRSLPIGAHVAIPL